MTILFWISINPFVLFIFQRLKTTTEQKKRHCYNYVLIYIVKGLEPYKGMATSSGRSRTKLSAFRVFLFQCNYKKEPFNCTVTGYKMDYVFSKWLITFMFKTLQSVQWIPHTHPQIKNSIKPTAINFNAFCKNLKVVYFLPLSYLMVICFQINLIVLTTINSYLVVLELELCW